jgi:hypothetical protein
MTRTAIVIAAALALAVALPAVSAQAQSIRTFVSTAGSDNPSCSLASPCRHFQAAVAATAVGGEVDALDPGAYGSFTISQAISIEGQGWSYVAPPDGGSAISITAPAGDNIDIRGVSLNGVGTTNTNGIIFFSGASLNVQNSVIRNLGNAGIDYGPNASSHLLVSNTLISDNGQYGIYINNGGSGTVDAVFDNVAIENNLKGLLLAGGASAMVRNCTVADNVFYGLDASGTGATIRVTRSTITGNATGWSVSSSGVVLSYGDNNIDNNPSGNTAPPPIVYK